MNTAVMEIHLEPVVWRDTPGRARIKLAEHHIREQGNAVLVRPSTSEVSIAYAGKGLTATVVEPDELVRWLAAVTWAREWTVYGNWGRRRLVPPVRLTETGDGWLIISRW